MRNAVPLQATGIVVGVDTHRDEHTAVAIDQVGVRVDDYRMTTTVRGYADFERWAKGLDNLLRGNAVTDNTAPFCDPLLKGRHVAQPLPWHD